jgi:drug/metabolite transporter (DMT)-like permease
MIVDSLKRGITAGVVAGLAYGLFMALVGNPLVEHLEHLAHHDHGHGHDHAHAVSELTTAVVSVGSGVLWGILLGAAFGTAYYLFEPSLPGVGSAKAYILSSVGFLTVSGVPWLALPPVAPGTEQALATDTRLLIYGGLMVLGALIAALSVAFYKRVREQHGPVPSVAAAVTPFALCAIPILLVPTNTLATPELAGAFVWLVVLSQVALWTIIASVYTTLDRRAERTAPSASELDEDLTVGV